MEGGIYGRSAPNDVLANVWDGKMGIYISRSGEIIGKHQHAFVSKSND